MKMKIQKKQIPNRKQILKQIASLLEPWLDDTEKSHPLNEQTDLLTDLGIDSIAILQLILNIERVFAIKIDDSEIDSEMLSRTSRFIDMIERISHENN